MKKDWTYKKLGEVATAKITDLLWFQEGPGIRKNQYTEDGVKLLNVANLVNGTVDLSTSSRYISEEEAYGKYKHFLVDEGDLIIASSGIQVSYFDKKMGFVTADQLPLCMNTSTIRFKVLDNSITDIKYFMYYLKSYPFKRQLAKYITGSAQLNFGPSHLKQMSMPLYPLSIQRSIVAELDLLHSVISKKKEQLRELDNLAQSLFYQMFGDPITNPMGWEIKKLGEVGTFERGKGISKSDFVDDGVPCVHYGQLHTAFGAYTTKHLACIPESLIDNPRIAHPGDVLLALTSEDVEGSCKSTAWYGDYDIIVGSDAAVYHHNQDGMYISFYTRTEAFYKQKEKYAHGFKVTHISTKDIETFTIPLPPLSLQQSFATRVSAIEAQKQAITQSIQHTEAILAQRMDNYFGI